MKYCFPFAAVLLLLAGCSPRAGGPPPANHLAGESSPYLLQHARNPVDWRPWGPEALDKAAQEQKLLVISIGYAACHWCHVMEHESFEDTTVARVMNENFVSIKVDREERPDIDDIYMTACQLVSQRGCGWPLNVFALPDGQPVWAGAYFPRRQWLETLAYFAKIWREEPEKLRTYARQVTRGVQQSDAIGPPPEEIAFEGAALESPVNGLLEEMDFQYGGRKGAPKFPMPNIFEFLLRYHHQTGEEKALEAIRVTLDRMAAGGIYDQLGGGFARYATDKYWLAPHFEKMLYDNAQLVSLYAKAYQATDDTAYRRIVEETLAFVARELTGPDGNFYASLDADSEGEEGRFYTWEKEEIDSILGDPDWSELFCQTYGVTRKGNWEGRNILHRPDGLRAPADSGRLAQARQRLFTARSQRERPGLDNKSLTAWNALMLQGYADAFRATGTAAYRTAALANGRFLRNHMLEGDYRLWRNYLDGKTAVNGFLDDYAQTILAFIRLYEITFDESWLNDARGLADYTLSHFADTATSLFFYTSELDPALVSRPRPTEDNVIPSANSTLARGLFYLGAYFYEARYTERARAMARDMAAALSDNLSPDYYTNWHQLWLDLCRPPFEVAIVGPQAGAVRDQLARHYLPDVLLLGGPREGDLQLLQNKLQEGETFIYVCRNKVCRLPVREVDQALRQIGQRTLGDTAGPK